MTKKRYYPISVATMASNTTPAPFVVSASSENSSQPAWKAFANSWWYASSPTPQWITMNFGELKELNYMKFSNAGNATSIPTSYTVSGSKDGVVFTDLATETYTWDTVSRQHTIEFPKGFYKAIKLTVNSISGAGTVIVGGIIYGCYTIASLVLKSPKINEHYSLADKTLIYLPNTSDKSIILHGIEQGKEVQLDVTFDKKSYPINESVTLGIGRVFEVSIGNNNEITNTIIREV